jgi:hypothetical protein
MKAEGSHPIPPDANDPHSSSKENPVIFHVPAHVILRNRRILVLTIELLMFFAGLAYRLLDLSIGGRGDKFRAIGEAQYRDSTNDRVLATLTAEQYQSHSDVIAGTFIWVIVMVFITGSVGYLLITIWQLYNGNKRKMSK